MQKKEIKPVNTFEKAICDRSKQLPYLSEPGFLGLAKGLKNGRVVRGASGTGVALIVLVDWGRAGQLAEPVLSFAEGLKQGPPAV